MKAFYSDTFVLPLPEQHRFPMAKYRLLRERLVEEGILAVDDLQVPDPVAWEDLRLVHDGAYVDAVASGTLPADARRRIGFPWSAMMEVSDLDVTFEDGAGDEEYLTALRAHLPGVFDGQRPDLVFYLAGADPYEGDRLGRLKLTMDGLRARDRAVFNACRDRDLPVVVAMSGGYAPDVDAIVTIHSNTIREAVHSCLSVSAS